MFNIMNNIKKCMSAFYTAFLDMHQAMFYTHA